MEKLLQKAKEKFEKFGVVNFNYYQNRDYSSPEKMKFTSLSAAIDFIKYVYENQNDDISVL